MGKSFLLRRKDGLVGVLVLAFLFLVSSCSDDNPTDPDSGAQVSGLIDGAGGILSLNDQIHLYVPEGVIFNPVRFGLEEVSSPPSPPEGFVQVGSAFKATVDEDGFGSSIALGMEFEYSHYGELTGKMVQLSKLAEGDVWEAVPGCGTSFSLGLGATVEELGTFAAHVDTSSGEPGDVMAMIYLSSGFGMYGGMDRTWRTYLSASFWNHDQTEILTDTGGPVRIGDFELGAAPGFYYYNSYQHEVQAGEELQVRLVGGEEIPALDDTLKFFDEEMVLTNPTGVGEIVDRTEPYRISWDGAGPEMVWLAVYGTGIDGEFEFNGGMRPNSGEYILSVEEMGMFEEGALVTVFLQRTKAWFMEEDGFCRGSYLFVEAVSTGMVVIE